jgi:hypothetical protein
MAMLSTQEREEIYGRIDRATPGPWTLHQAGTGYDRVEGPTVGDAARTVLAKEKVHGHSEDYEFIAHARADLPRCLEALEEAELLLSIAAKNVSEDLANRIRAYLGSASM